MNLQDLIILVLAVNPAWQHSQLSFHDWYAVSHPLEGLVDLGGRLKTDSVGTHGPEVAFKISLQQMAPPFSHRPYLHFGASDTFRSILFAQLPDSASSLPLASRCTARSRNCESFWDTPVGYQCHWLLFDDLTESQDLIKDVLRWFRSLVVLVGKETRQIRWSCLEGWSLGASLVVS